MNTILIEEIERIVNKIKECRTSEEKKMYVKILVSLVNELSILNVSRERRVETGFGSGIRAQGHGVVECQNGFPNSVPFSFANTGV